MNCPPQNHPTTPKFPSLYNPLVERYRECDQRYASVTYLETASDIFKFTLYWTLILYTPVFALPAIWGLVVHFIPHRLSRRRQRRRENASESAFPLSHIHNRQYSATGGNDAGIHMASSPLSSEPFLLDSPVVPTIKAPSTRAETIRQRGTLAQAFSSNNNSWGAAQTLRMGRKKQNDSYLMAPASNMSAFRGAQANSNVRPPQSSLRNRSAGITCLILTIPLVFLIIGAVVGVIGSLVIGYLLAALRGSAQVKISTWLPLGWAIVQVHTVILGCFTNMISFI
ncbi:hypothetical protein CPB86DRAFT_692750 [Serendipita vermifera]|nr:hypothetical protein CPB86DRAFT_692750 [Serendipita vermifera]